MPLKHNNNPLLAPWPPGVDHRIVILKNGAKIFQLRPGAAMPKSVYLMFMSKAIATAAGRSAANPCLN